ncbi:unnamed protein product [Paramecium sonneborni]|uniref:EF-hand domain-containing protein n=1 Tax=Paramecium sonneborni TaxID=65129 RepID=A0A8S1PXF6_9CILI|nr:unnamed protein product [Paramecium sonneborni]
MDYRIGSASMSDLESAKLVAKKLFETYDRDRNGVIDTTETIPMIVDAYKSFNRSFQPTRGDIDSYSKVMDRNGDGKVTYQDIEELCIKYLCPQYSQQSRQQNNKPQDPRIEVARRVFRKYDTDNSGFLNVQEIQKMIAEAYRSMGLPQPTYKDIQAWLDAADTNQDGFISLQEFEQFVLKSL